MKLAGGARFDCVGSTQEFTCYMAGFAYPLRSHLRLDEGVFNCLCIRLLFERIDA